MNPVDAPEIFKTVADKGAWGLSVFLVLVNIATMWILFRYFSAKEAVKDGIIKAFADAWDRQTEAFNRRTRSENLKTEMEALQLASRPDIHPDLKNAASDAVRRIKDEIALSPDTSK